MTIEGVVYQDSKAQYSMTAGVTWLLAQSSWFVLLSFLPLANREPIMIIQEDNRETYTGNLPLPNIMICCVVRHNIQSTGVVDQEFTRIQYISYRYSIRCNEFVFYA